MNSICKEGKNNNACNRETERIKQKGHKCKKWIANQNFLNNNRMERQGIREGVWSQGVQYSICKILTSHKIHLQILKALVINNKIVNGLKNLLIYIVAKRWITL